MCRVSHEFRAHQNQKPTSQLNHVWNTHFFTEFALGHAPCRTPHLAITHTGNKGTWAGDSSSSSVYVSHGASIFYHLVRVTHNVSNDVSQGGRPLLAVGDNGSMAVSQRAAPGEVSL